MLSLGEFATVALGQKTLLNDFFHVTETTASTFGMEDRFLKPLYLLADLDTAKYIQTQASHTKVFHCRELPADLRGTGAERYIAWGAKQVTGDKKQSGGKTPWPDSPAMAGKKHWYWPTEPLKEGRVALRKGIGDVYAPFLFTDPVAFDQRLYVLTANQSIGDDVLAAYMSSSLFALALEVNADMGLGGGVLSFGTKALRCVPTVDLSLLAAPAAKAAVLAAAKSLHSQAPPKGAAYPRTPALAALDEAILDAVGQDSARASELENEVALQLGARRNIKELRKKTQTKTEDVNVLAVATGAIDRLSTWLAPRQWPRDFDGPTPTLDFPAGEITIDVSIVLGQAEITVRSLAHKVLMQHTYEEAVAEVLLRALQFGRRRFSLPTTEAQAVVALARLAEILADFDTQFDEAIFATGVGPRFEADVRQRVLTGLGVQLTTMRIPFHSGEWHVGGEV